MSIGTINTDACVVSVKREAQPRMGCSGYPDSNPRRDPASLVYLDSKTVQCKYTTKHKLFYLNRVYTEQNS